MIEKGKLLYVSKQRYDLLKPTSDDLVPKVTSGKESFYNNYERKIDTETRNETTWTYLINQTASMSI